MEAISDDLEHENVIYSNYNGEVIALDTEWTSNNEPICLQLYIPKYEAKIIVINSDLKPINPTIYQENIISYRNNHKFCSALFEFSFKQADHSALVFALQAFYKKKKLDYPKKILLLFYYSVKDLINAFGKDAMYSPMRNGNTRRNSTEWVDQNRSISGQLIIQDVKYVLFDMYGFEGKSLKESCATFGVELENKSSMDSYKKAMENAFFNPSKSVRNTFLRYSISDVTDLYRLWTSRIEKHNELLVETFGFTDEYLIHPQNFPATTGRLVADTFENFLSFQLAKQVDVSLYKLALHRVGYLNPKHPKYKDNVIAREEIYKDASDPIKREELIKDKKLIDKHCNKKVYEFNGQNLGSIPYFFTFDKKSFAVYSSMVSGARTVNEKPEILTMERTLDADLQSCYGSALERFKYVIGNPLMYNKPVNTRGLTLRTFLQRYEKQLVKNCYQITVSGSLSFEQDLIMSKLVSKRAVNKNYESYEKEDGRSKAVDTSLILLRKEIENGIITTDVLDLIKAIGTNREKNEFYNLEVLSALYYPKDLQCANAEEWAKACLETPFNYGEPNFWVAIELCDFIGPLIKKRRFFQQEFKKTGLLKFQAYQLCLKLIINTLYGCITSSFFNIGNVCLANNITSFARCQMWLLVKALNGNQSITDGCVFPPENVLFHKKGKIRLPGFDALANANEFDSQRYLNTSSLGGLDWKSLFDNYNFFDGIEVDKLIVNHVNDFFLPYNVSLKLNVELKLDNTAIKTGFFAKAHYCLLTFDKLTNSFSKKKYWIRGHREFTNNKRDPYFSILENLLDGTFKIPLDLTYFSGGLLKIREWRQKVKASGSFSLLPGEAKPISQHTLSFNFNHFKILNLSEYNMITKNKNKYQTFSDINDMLQQMKKDAGAIRDKVIKKLNNK